MSAEAVARLKIIEAQLKTSEEIVTRQGVIQNTLIAERLSLREHCDHPQEYVDKGFLYTICRLCGASD